MWKGRQGKSVANEDRGTRHARAAEKYLALWCVLGLARVGKMISGPGIPTMMSREWLGRGQGRVSGLESCLAGVKSNPG